jgi:hypothetical protein
MSKSKSNLSEEMKTLATSPTLNPTTGLSGTIFSQEEILSIIKGFILAWLQGNVSIRFPTAEEIVSMNKETGVETGIDEARQQEFAGKNVFTELILICSGIEPSSLDEQEEAYMNLFNRILAYRVGQRIEGTFSGIFS